MVDVSDMAREAGFRFPVAVTRAVWDEILTPSHDHTDQSVEGRLWDCLWVLTRAIHTSPGNTHELPFVFMKKDEGGYKIIELKAICHPGDMMEPVITIMLPDED